MSGIAGAVRLDGQPLQESLLDRMAAETSHLGLDGVASWRAGPAGMLRFRLNTTPQSLTEQQPYYDALTQSSICFDGRLDNRAELLHLLQLSAGVADCEIALALFRRMGDGFLDRLVGDYSLAIWQRGRQRLLCARSPGGWRPFLWSCDQQLFTFASEPRTLVRGVGLTRQLNEGAIAEFLSSCFVTPTETFWSGVYRLAPGSALALENGRVRKWHWHTGPFEDLCDLPESDHIERFLHLFDQALMTTTRSAGPVAAHLSGGLDSSSIVCRSAQLHRLGHLDSMVHPVSARFPGEPHDESRWSSAVEEHLGIPARLVVPEEFNFDVAHQWCGRTLHLPLRPNTLGTIVATCDRLLQDGMHVLLTGEGGDDWLSGGQAHLSDMLQRRQWRRLINVAWREENERSIPQRIVAVARSARPLLSPRHRQAAIRQLTTHPSDIPEWLREDWAHRVHLRDRWHADVLPVDLPSLAQQQRYRPFFIARRHVNIENVMSYAATQGVELRHPFYDLRLTRFLMGAAGNMLLRNGKRKHLLRETMRTTLPEVIRTRQTKTRFILPVVNAIASRFLQVPPQEMLVAKLGWIKPEKMDDYQRIYRRWCETGTTGSLPPKASISSVWAAVAMDVWLKEAAGV